MPRGPRLGLGMAHGGSLFSPLSLSGLRIFLTSDVGVTSSATFTWADQSGNGFNATQATAGKFPTIIASAFGSLPGIKFVVATAAELDFTPIGTAILNGATGAERFLVLKNASDPPASGGGYVVSNGMWGTSGTADDIPFNDGLIYDGFARNHRPGFAKVKTYTSPVIYSSNVSQPGAAGTGVFNAYENGTLTAASATSNETYGANVSSPQLAVGYGVDCTLAAFIVINRSLSIVERYQMHRWLGAKYGIAVP